MLWGRYSFYLTVLIIHGLCCVLLLALLSALGKFDVCSPHKHAAVTPRDQPSHDRDTLHFSTNESGHRTPMRTSRLGSKHILKNPEVQRVASDARTMRLPTRPEKPSEQHCLGARSTEPRITPRTSRQVHVVELLSVHSGRVEAMPRWARSAAFWAKVAIDRRPFLELRH